MSRACCPRASDASLYAKRAVVTKKLKPVPVEAIARGYLIGSGWKDYQRTGRVSGIALPDGLRQAEQLPQPIFTPFDEGRRRRPRREHRLRHDGAHRRRRTRRTGARRERCACTPSRATTRRSAASSSADTKFEFGTDEDGRLYVMDEMLTPDSSRYWPADEYQVGISPPSYDKQFVRDYLEQIGWDKTPPGPAPAAEVIERTRAKYAERCNASRDSRRLDTSPEERDGHRARRRTAGPRPSIVGSTVTPATIATH
jgi:phosphoribosylaminoimidazole-succinocarboxamide synthase